MLLAHIGSNDLQNLKRGRHIGAAQNNRNNTIFAAKSQACVLSTIPHPNDLPQLSGGEEQRISLARGLRDTPIMILDEPTSALDTLTEQTIIDNYNTFMQQQTQQKVLLMTGHRLKTVQSAAKILVIENGSIIERGTHAELNSTTNGTYRRYYTTQADTHSFRFHRPAPLATTDGQSLPRPPGYRAHK